MAKNSFSVQVDDIKAPVSPNGELLITSGRTEGQAKVAFGQAVLVERTAEASLLKSLTSVGEAGAKAYASSQARDKINSTIDHLQTDTYTGSAIKKQQEDAVPKAQASVLGAQGLAAKRDSLDNFDYLEGGVGQQTNREIQAFRDEAQRYVSAASQGAIGRDEAIAQIGATVKKYSAMVPGWASDFRKIGAELTGISHVDSYGVHQALTQQGMAEKQRAKMQEIELALTKEYMGEFGLTKFEQVTPEGLALWRNNKGMDQYVKQAENRKKLGDMSQDQADQANDQIAGAYITQAVSGVASKFAQLNAAHLGADTPLKAEEARRLGGRLAADLQVVQAGLESQLNQLTTGQNAWSRARADKVTSEMRAVFKNYQEAVSTSEGYDYWNQLVKGSKGNVEHLMNTMMLANPHLAVLKETGVLPEMAKAWFSLNGDQKQFAARFGTAAANTMDVVMKEPKTYANEFRQVVTGQSTVADVAARNPEIAKVVYNDVVTGVQKLVEEGGVLRNEQKQSFSNMIAGWVGNMNHTKPEELKKFRELMFNPNMVRLMDQLDPTQRANALAPLFSKIDTTTPNVVEDVKQLVEKYNGLNQNQKFGNKMEVVYDKVAGAFRWEVKASTPSKFVDTPSGAASIGLGGVGFYGPRSSIEQRELTNTLDQRLGWLNSVPHVLSNMVPMAGGGKANSDQVFEEIWKGVQGGTTTPLLSGKVKEMATGVPKNTQTAAAAFPVESPAQRDEAARLQAQLIVKDEGKEYAQERVDLLKRIASKTKHAGLLSGYQAEINALEAALK